MPRTLEQSIEIYNYGLLNIKNDTMLYPKTLFKDLCRTVNKLGKMIRKGRDMDKVANMTEHIEDILLEIKEHHDYFTIVTARSINRDSGIICKWVEALKPDELENIKSLLGRLQGTLSLINMFPYMFEDQPTLDQVKSHEEEKTILHNLVRDITSIAPIADENVDAVYYDR